MLSWWFACLCWCRGELPDYWVGFYDANSSVPKIGRYHDFLHIQDLEERKLLRECIRDIEENDAPEAALLRLEEARTNGSAEAAFLLCLVGYFEAVEHLPPEKLGLYVAQCDRSDSILGMERRIAITQAWHMIEPNMIYSRFAKAAHTQKPRDLEDAKNRTEPFTLEKYALEKVDMKTFVRLARTCKNYTELYEYAVANEYHTVQEVMKLGGLVKQPGGIADLSAHCTKEFPLDECTGILDCFVNETVQLSEFENTGEINVVTQLHQAFPSIPLSCSNVARQEQVLLASNVTYDMCVVCSSLRQTAKKALRDGDAWYLQRLASFGLDCGSVKPQNENHAWKSKFFGDNPFKYPKFAWKCKNVTFAFELMDAGKMEHPESAALVLIIKVLIVLKAFASNPGWRAIQFDEVTVYDSIMAVVFVSTLIFLAAMFHARRMNMKRRTELKQ